MSLFSRARSAFTEGLTINSYRSSNVFLSPLIHCISRTEPSCDGPPEADKALNAELRAEILKLP